MPPHVSGESTILICLLIALKNENVILLYKLLENIFFTVRKNTYI